MSRLKKIFEYYPFTIILISLLFLTKALFLSFFVTPFSGVPDEIGHFAYVQDIAYGKGIPILSPPVTGKSIIDASIMAYVEDNPHAQAAYNWIAQHPPVYYAIAAIPLKIGSFFTSDKEILFRLPRIVSALSGAFLLLVLFRTFRITGLDAPRATAISAAIGFVPMVSNLSSGTNHDMALFLFCAIATYFFARYVLDHRIKHAYWCAIWLSIAGGTKMMTPWVLLVPILLIFLLELPSSNRIRHAIGISLLSLSLPIAWMARNFAYFGNPLYTSGTDRKPELNIPLNKSFSDFMSNNPVFDTVIHWFYGAFVSFRKGPEKLFLEYDTQPRYLRLAMATADDLPYRIFQIIILILACACLIYFTKLILKILKGKSTSFELDSFFKKIHDFLECHRKLKLIPLFLSMIIGSLLFAFIISINTGNLKFLLSFPVSISVFLGILGCSMVLYTQDNIDRIALYGFSITAFFGSVFLFHVYQAFLTEGQMLATQGRYFYPVIPLMLLSVAIALRRLQIPEIAIKIGVALMACTELFVYAQQVLPFYMKFS